MNKKTLGFLILFLAIIFCGGQGLIMIWLGFDMIGDDSRSGIVGILGGMVFISIPIGLYFLIFRLKLPKPKTQSGNLPTALNIPKETGNIKSQVMESRPKKVLSPAESTRVLFMLVGSIILIFAVEIILNKEPATETQEIIAERRAVQTSLKNACSGEGVNNAAPYDSNATNLHPIAILNAKGKPHEWSNLLPADWFPSSVGVAELVVCLDDEEEKLIEKCVYVDEFWGTGERVPRIQYMRSYKIVAVQTGEVIHSDTILGDMPPVCPPRLEGQSGTLRLSGSNPTYSDLEKVLMPFVVAKDK